MHTNGARLIMPLLNFLDGIIRQYGDYLFIIFCLAAVALIMWILKGGMRRRLSRLSGLTAPGSIIVIKTSVKQDPPLPPIGEDEPDPLSDRNDSDYFAR